MQQKELNISTMAAIQVDLLGDEVDTLLSLLEKIYAMLDHYSPVLQHYPGILDLLKPIKSWWIMLILDFNFKEPFRYKEMPFLSLVSEPLVINRYNL